MGRYNIVSLFSGAGGLDLGFIQTGEYRVVFANDLLVSAATTYAKNFDLRLEVCDGSEEAEITLNTVLACDVSNVDFSSMRDFDVDLVVGGPPCQDFSLIRGPSWDRKGIEVKRGKLYAHFIRSLVALQPKMFVFENVPGLMSANEGNAYRVILEDFKGLRVKWQDVKKMLPDSDNNGRVEGYEIVFADVVDFAGLGVPQRRERLLVLGVRRDLARSPEILKSFKRGLEVVLGGKKWLFSKYPLTPIEVFEGRRLDELGEKYREVMRRWEGVWEEVGTARAFSWRRDVWDKLTLDIVKDYITVNCVRDPGVEGLKDAFNQHEEILRELGYYGRSVHTLSLPDRTTELPKESSAVAERMKRIPPGENYEFIRGTQWEVEGKGISLVYRRIHPLKPSYTISAYGGGGTYGYHYDRNRATLTLREKARLQTFPDGFLFYGKKSEIRAQIGEAIPPLAAKRLAESLTIMLEILG